MCKQPNEGFEACITLGWGFIVLADQLKLDGGAFELGAAREQTLSSAGIGESKQAIAPPQHLRTKQLLEGGDGHRGAIALGLGD